ncbi:hypothetical protein [Hyphomicrobium sp. MC1]|uniref:hypothetical protein n=1 Tax=Hyphomicrobium sp. (strain MC1) TaxID=717785 RepID=UPI000681E92C|nr:hypothetical protein [Hyphomicrobium sp. MC1]
MSNRAEQPLRLACPNCGAAIDIVVAAGKMTLTGAKQVQPTAPFDAKTPFADLHLDFPVSFEPYKMGMTPFMRAAARVGIKEMDLHQSRLHVLDQNHEQVRRFKTMLAVYANNKLVPFKLNLRKYFNIEVASDSPQDVEAALYMLIAKMMLPFEYPLQSKVAVDQYLQVLHDLHGKERAGLEGFVVEIVGNSFLGNLHRDILDIYPRILDAELALRPVLLLDFDEGYAKNPTPMRVSTRRFDDFKDLYKDISEVLSRQLVLVAGINNLIKRGNHDAFKEKLNRFGKNTAPDDLDAYADVVFGLKSDHLDDCWYLMLDGSISNHLRNAIAHTKTEYDDITQLVTYFPKREGMEQAQGQTIYFLEFMRLLLVSYREARRLHHLAKALNYYYLLHMTSSNASGTL